MKNWIEVFKSTLSKRLLSSWRYQSPTVCKIQNTHLFLPLFRCEHTNARVYWSILARCRNLHRKTKDETNKETQCVWSVWMKRQSKDHNKLLGFVCDRFTMNCVWRTHTHTPKHEVCIHWRWRPDQTRVTIISHGKGLPNNALNYSVGFDKHGKQTTRLFG